MKNPDTKYFENFRFTPPQIEKYLENAEKDIQIAEEDKILDVKFNYCYSALLKAGITLLCSKSLRLKSVPGHHIKMLEVLSEFLKDEKIYTIGNLMRSKRNMDLYSGGTYITEKECKEYLSLVKSVIKRVKETIEYKKLSKNKEKL